jgi:hypothetical protein
MQKGLRPHLLTPVLELKNESGLGVSKNKK